MNVELTIEAQALVRDWNLTDAELGDLWEQGGHLLTKKKWQALAGPLFHRLHEIEDELAPLLHEWVKANGVMPGDYGRIRRHTGLKAHGKVIGQMLTHVANEEAKKSLEVEGQS